MDCKARRRCSGLYYDSFDQYVFYIHIFLLLFSPVTPFDVVKTRLQTQPLQQQPLFSRPPPNSCCQSTHSAPCIRRMSSIARSISSDVVCVWEAGVFRTERVNGFTDAVNHVWRAEGLRGLWKGVGTSL